MKEKQEVKGTVWLWTLIGGVPGGWLGTMVGDIIGGIIAAIVLAILAYRSSAKNGGAAPSWLWRSKRSKR